MDYSLDGYRAAPLVRIELLVNNQPVDALSIIKTEKVKLSVLDPNSSCLITPEQKAHCQYVVMPMKL